MKLSPLTIDVLKGNEEIKQKLAELLDVDVSTIYRNINQNKEFGPLTSYGVIEFISKETGLEVDKIKMTDYKIQTV